MCVRLLYYVIIMLLLLKGLKLHDEFLEQHCSLDYCDEPFVVLLFAVTAILDIS